MNKPNVRELLSWSLVAAFLVAAAVALRSSGSDVRASLRTIGAGPMALSGFLALLGVQAAAFVWFSLARGAGMSAPATSALAMYNVSQLGKYVPGSIWPLVAQMEFARRSDTPRRVLLAAYTLVVLVLCTTGLILGVSLLVVSGTSTAAPRYSWLLLFVPALFVGLHPRVVPNLLSRALALAGKDVKSLKVQRSAIGKAVGWSVVSWILLGLHLAVLLRSLGESGSSVITISTGAMALGWATGLLVVFAPAGLGVRDSVIVVSVAGLVGGGPALAIAVASRVLLLFADLALAGLGLLMNVRSRLRI